MAEPAHPLRTPPPLPGRLLALGPIVSVGACLWLATTVVFLIIDVPPVWLWTAAAGSVLGIAGVLIILWQRWAARRGAKGAQKVT